MFWENVSFVHAGLFTAPDTEWKHPARTIDTTELILVQKGCVMLREGTADYCAKAGDFLRLSPQMPHFGTRKSEEAVSFYWIHINGEIPDAFPKQFTLSEAYRPNLLCKQILHYANTPGYPQEAADYAVRLLMMELSVQAKQPQRENARLTAVCEWLRIHVDKPLHSQEVAARFGYNEDYLSRLFRQRFGIGLKQYISEEKLRRIKTLLLSPDYSLQEIAAMTGFADYKYFLKFFRYHEGSTPTAFRSLYFNTHQNNR